MSSKRDNPDNDKLVADTYRSLPRERAPEHVNQRVLRMAASANRTRYARTRAWIRPMAWAATIGLSVAIVLEITRLPQTDPDLPFAEQSPAGATQPSRSPQPATVSPGNGDGASPATTAVGGSVPALEDDFVPRNMDVLREAEGMARTQAGPKQPAADARTDTVTTVEEIAPKEQRSPQPAAKRTAPAKAVVRQAAQAESSFAVVAEPEMTAAGTPCPDEVRDSARSWLACIAELRELGSDDLAEFELGEFRKKYPDLAESNTDR